MDRIGEPQVGILESVAAKLEPSESEAAKEFLCLERSNPLRAQGGHEKNGEENEGRGIVERDLTTAKVAPRNRLQNARGGSAQRAMVIFARYFN